MDTIEADDILSNDYEEDDFSDTDSEYEWENEGQLGPQTTQLGPQTTENLRATDDILSSEPEGDDFSVTDDEIEWKKEKQLGPQRTYVWKKAVVKKFADINKMFGGYGTCREIFSWALLSF